ncbi:putative ankyrin repeat protein RF_0381 [Watersipora subatra]|uniref:putative ankyrin repeat protein RF_0381 n=1 Tax=Watersipora subatra TaxID=2589382 RepID=UPI00355BF680
MSSKEKTSEISSEEKTKAISSENKTYNSFSGDKTTEISSEETTREQIIAVCRKGDIEGLKKLLLSLTEKEKTGLRVDGLQNACVEGGSLECLKELTLGLDMGAQAMKCKNSSGYSSLHLAVQNGQQEMVSYLLRSGADVNDLDDDNHTPLYWAVVQSNPDMLSELIRAGADLIVEDSFKAIPLHYAVQICENSKEESVKTVELLLECSESINHPDSGGRTPIIWACSVGSHTATRMLIKAGADVTLTDSDGLTGLHCAASHGHSEVIDVLVSKSNCEVDCADQLGCTPLFYAASHGQPSALQKLLTYGANPNHRDARGRTASHCAAAQGRTDLLQLLEERGADLWIKSNRNEYPLQEGLANQFSESSFHLFDRADNSLDINERNGDGLTYLHLASKMGSEDLVNYLIDKSADVGAVYTTKTGVEVSALDICDKRGHQACSKLLEKYDKESSRQAGSRPASSKQCLAPHISSSKFDSPASKASQKSPSGKQNQKAPSKQPYEENLARRRSSLRQNSSNHNVKKEVTIDEHVHVDVYSKENYTSRQATLPVLTNQKQEKTAKRVALYNQTMLPFNRPRSASFVNVSAHIRRPKTAPVKKHGSQPISNKVQESVLEYNTIRDAARNVQDKYLKGPRADSARPVPLQPRSSRHMAASHSQSTANRDQSPTYTIIATRGGFTKVRDNSQIRKNDPELLKDLHKNKGNGILYVMDANSHDTVGFTQGFDGRLRPRLGLVLNPPNSNDKQ